MILRIGMLMVMILAASGCRLLDREEYRVGEEVRIAYRFVGGEGISKRVLADVVHDYMAQLSREPERLSLAYDAALELEDRFHLRGYPQAQVSYKVLPAKGRQPVTVVFEIAQGPQVTVKHIEFAGNQALGREQLLELWSRRRSGVLGLDQPLYVVHELLSLAEAIRDTYRREGYLDVQVKVVYPEAIVAAQPEVDLQVAIEEGVQYRVGAVTVAQDLMAALGERAPPLPPAGQVFKPELQSQLTIEINNTLRSIGHHAAGAVASVSVHPDTKRVDITVGGTPGPKGVVTGVVVNGNDYVDTERIREPFVAGMGQLYDGRRVQEGLRRLYRTGLFHKVEVNKQVVGDAKADPQQLRLNLDVEEADRYSIQPGIGYGSYEKLRGLLEFRMRAVPLLGYDLLLRGTASEKGYRAGAMLTDLDFLGTETTWQTGGDIVSREEPSFKDRYKGVVTSWSRYLVKDVHGRLGYAYRTHSNAQSDVVDPGAQIGDYQTSRIFLELDSDHRDSVLVPRKGHREFLRVDFVSPALGGDRHFTTLEVGWSAHLPLVENLQLVLGSRHGWLWPGDGSDRVPIQERLFNGGENTVRSYNEAELGPKDVNGEPVGGEFRNILGVEMRCQILTNLEIAAFADAGNVGRQVEDYTFDDLKYGLGGGIRILLPIGPVRLDAAYNPDRDPGDEVWELHFSVGYPY
ncbi:MAG: BamA/OMP85 family outer membrane protein [Planctomycetota bacterium]